MSFEALVLIVGKYGLYELSCPSLRMSLEPRKVLLLKPSSLAHVIRHQKRKGPRPLLGSHPRIPAQSEHLIETVNSLRPSLTSIPSRAKPGPYEQRQSKPKAQPMKAQPPGITSKGQGQDEGPTKGNSRRGSVEVEPGQRRGSLGKVSRSSSNQSLAGGDKRKPEPAPAPAPPAAQPSSSNETVKDDPQFMGEVESLLQEHGIEVDPGIEDETVAAVEAERQKSAPRPKPSATASNSRRVSSPK
jgi:hypothetical protein